MIKYAFKQKGVLIAYLLLVPCMALTSVWFSKSLQPLIDCVFVDKANGFWTVSGIAILACVADMLATGWHKSIREKLRCVFLTGLRQDVFRSVMKLDIPEYNGKGVSHYLNIVTRDIQSINKSYFDSVCGIYRVIVCFVVTLGALIWMNPVLALLNVGISAVSVFLPQLLNKRLVAAQNKASQSSEDFLRKTKDYLNGFTTIRLFNIGEKVGLKFGEENEKQIKADYSSVLINYWTSWISMLCTTLCYVLTIIIGAWYVMEGKMTVGAILAISQLIGGIAVPFEELPVYLTELNSIKDIKNKLMRLLEVTISEEQQSVLEKTKCDIELKNVSFSYDESKAHLDDITYHFEAGKKYAVIGESGSGKSTLAKVMMGFYPIATGQLNVGQTDINLYSRKQLYRMLNYMEQNVFLFEDTLYNNLTLYGEYTNDEIERVIKISGLKEFVDGLEQGLDTWLSEDGSNVSGGERQRIGLARILLLGAKYLILDETTSSLDVMNEKQIENSLLQLDDVGCVFITHRLNPMLLERCDEIVLLKDGKIDEHGTFHELMEKKEYFYSFYMINH